MRNNDWVGKRSSMRQNCQMRGEMRFLDGSAPSECTIVDISASGCRIELEAAYEVPEDFDLYIPSRSELKIAKVRRQDGQRLGVAFLKSRLDDPLVMQTLLERVARLERGYTEVKAVVGVDGGKPAGTATAKAPSTLIPPVDSGPLVEHRLKALGDGLQELRVLVDKLANAPTQASVDLVTDRANESAAEIAGLKEQISSLAGAMRGMTVGAQGEASDQSGEIANMKGEMTRLSVALRNLVEQIPKSVAMSKAASGDTGSSGAENMQMAKMKADIAQLRAAMEVLQSSATAPAAMAKLDDLAALRMEIAELRKATSQGLTDMRANMDELAATSNAHAEPTRVVAIAADVAALKQEMASLGETLREVTTRAHAESPNYSADLAHMKAEMLKLSIAMREMAAELPSVRFASEAIAAAGPDAIQWTKLNADMAQLRETMTKELADLRGSVNELADSAADIVAEPARTTAVISDVAGLKMEMAALAETLRGVTSQAYADAPKFSADLAHLKAEMLKLSISMKEMAAELPSVRFAGEAIAAGGAEAVQWSRVNSDIAQLRAAMTRGMADLRSSIDELADATADIVNEPARTTAVISDVAGLKTEMATLAETLRGATSQAYADAPKFSADLAHMKAEMLKLSISMKEMAAEMPSVRLADSPDSPAGIDAEQLAKIKMEIARLRAMIDERKDEALTASQTAQLDQLAQLRADVAQLREISRSPAIAVSAASPTPDGSEITDLRASVQTLILLVSQSLNRREAA